MLANRWLQRGSDGLRALRILAGSRPAVPGGLVLGYHDVGENQRITTDYYVSPTMLASHIEMATRAGLQFVPLSEMTDRLRHGLDVDTMISVVFDDALAGVHHHALPVLLEKGIPATIFVVSECLGVAPPWWDGAGRTMTAAELIECSQAGMSLGVHTRTHPSLPSISRVECRDEVIGSKLDLEDLADRAVSLFAYPFGHHDDRVRAEVEAAGYQAAFTFLNGRVQPGLDLLLLPRLTMSSRQDRIRFAYHLARAPQSWPDHQASSVGT